MVSPFLGYKPEEARKTSSLQFEKRGVCDKVIAAHKEAEAERSNVESFQRKRS